MYASVTSKDYGFWLNCKLKINKDYAFIHDVYKSEYINNLSNDNHESRSVFCGGSNGRDWRFLFELACQMKTIKFYVAMDEFLYKSYKKVIPQNVVVKTNISYLEFLCMRKASIVCLPLNTESPAGLIVMFQAASNSKMVITADTVTNREYITQDRGILLENNINLWQNAIEYSFENVSLTKNKALS